MGGDYDPSDESMREAIILAQDSTVEFYRGDTLYQKFPYRVIRREVGEGKSPIVELKLLIPNSEDEYRVTIEDPNHLWYSTPNVMDSFQFLYVR